MGSPTSADDLSDLPGTLRTGVGASPDCSLRRMTHPRMPAFMCVDWPQNDRCVNPDGPLQRGMVVSPTHPSESRINIQHSLVQRSPSRMITARLLVWWAQLHWRRRDLEGTLL
ncbi:hypothetical protein NDU88_003194 [Pleurodeles waltl]|uniref:Uncharacterized protein n=1 Tax=Pleurodeles waltl TaxID=8319 RepID=A0AAV7QC96_PLEWA|nr:hypothetical protein NDU88_003194 [Pleurodeles waltl]